MIDLYFAPTPNAQKVSIMLEEAELSYHVIGINLLQGDQFTPEFSKINPNHKIPAIVDHHGLGGKQMVLFESGAILMYLAEKSGKFLPQDTEKKYEVLQWLMFQMAGFGPMLGQTHHFLNYAPQNIPYAIARYQKETKRLYQVLDHQLKDQEYLAAKEYTIADMSVYPWVAVRKAHQIDLDEYPHVQRWYQQLKIREPLRKGFAIMRDQLSMMNISTESKKLLYGIDTELKMKGEK